MMRHIYYYLVCGCLLLAVTACSITPSSPVISLPLSVNLEQKSVRQCANFFVTLDQVTFDAQVVDAGYQRVPGFPYLRLNRFFASYVYPADQLEPVGKFNAWVDQLQRIDRQSRKIEIANLPVSVRTRLKQQFAGQLNSSKAAHSKNGLQQLVNQCGDTLRKADLVEEKVRAQLLVFEQYPDEYQTVKRVLGLYSIVSLFVKYGANKLHHEFKAVFNTPLKDLPVNGKMHLYQPLVTGKVARLTAAQVRAILKKSSDNPLSIVDPSSQDLQQLFETFAPVLEVDTQDDFDKPGEPGWTTHQVAQINTDKPTLYTLATQTRFYDKNLLQLVYVVWFPGRPLEGTFDILGGHMDGITWRVTLGADGKPVMYDAMHNCGCYHMFFPSEQLRLKKTYGVYEEVPLVPQMVKHDAEGRAILRIESKTHYLQRIYFDNSAAGNNAVVRQYQLQDYDQLRSLPLRGEQRKSLFAWDGLVKGTERSERWILWPMGVPEPGAMRQWGRHATAFIGKRHFDDAAMLQRFFVYE